MDLSTSAAFHFYWYIVVCADINHFPAVDKEKGD